MTIDVCLAGATGWAGFELVSGSQVHSISLPGFMIGAEVIFGMPDQTLTLRHDAGNSARPCVDGALPAIRKVGALVGVHRGLDAVLELWGARADQPNPFQPALTRSSSCAETSEPSSISRLR